MTAPTLVAVAVISAGIANVSFHAAVTSSGTNNATPPAVADPSGWNRLSRAIFDTSYGVTVPNQTWENADAEQLPDGYHSPG